MLHKTNPEAFLPTLFKGWLNWAAWLATCGGLVFAIAVNRPWLAFFALTPLLLTSLEKAYVYYRALGTASSSLETANADKVQLEQRLSQVSTDNLVVLQRTLEQASFQQAFSMIVEVVDYISRIQKLGPSPLPVRRLFPIGDAVYLAVKLDDDSLDAVRVGDFFWLTTEKNGVAHRVAMLRVAQLNVNEKSAFLELEKQVDAQICGSLWALARTSEVKGIKDYSIAPLFTSRDFESNHVQGALEILKRLRANSFSTDYSLWKQRS